MNITEQINGFNAGWNACKRSKAEIDELTATIAEYKKALDRADGEVAKVTSTAFKEWTIEERKQADAEIAELKKINKFITEGSNRALKIQQAEIDVIQNELNCAVETNGQLQDSCNELVKENKRLLDAAISMTQVVHRGK